MQNSLELRNTAAAPSGYSHSSQASNSYSGYHALPPVAPPSTGSSYCPYMPPGVTTQQNSSVHGSSYVQHQRSYTPTSSRSRADSITSSTCRNNIQPVNL